MSAILKPRPHNLKLAALGLPPDLPPYEASDGSVYYALENVSTTLMDAVIKAEPERYFRRLLLDSVKGIIQLMSPSRHHEATSRHADSCTTTLAELLEVSCVATASTLFQRPGRSTGGVEPDESYYLGENARAIQNLERSGNYQAADDFMDRTPPDLVVEVGVTHQDKDKQDIYCTLGVAELWQVDIPDRNTRTLSITFLHLLAQGGPQLVHESLGLPGVTPELLEEVIDIAWNQESAPVALSNRIRQALVEHGALPEVGRTG